MRIAVSGTHCCGKSTLIDAFLLNHPDFSHEPEPYIVLQEEYGEDFAAEPSLDDFHRQLEFNVQRLRCYHFGERVIYERSPVDFLAYLMAINDLQRDATNTRIIEDSLDVVIEAIQLLEVIVFLPLDVDDDVVFGTPDSEDLELRRAVDSRLANILNGDDLDLFSASGPKVLEAHGSTTQRLQTLEAFLSKPMAGHAKTD
ncbi:MAG TPA: hypothetical protein VFF31_27770 [Blastocatellia bacterium]|nr:hypothetical protein [Blastocatellia bacterium]